MKGAELYRELSLDVIVAVGGGSVLDAAKGIAILASNGGDIADYEGVDEIPNPMPPLLCIPTTSGTSADVSQFCIITDTTRNKKMAIVSKTTVPDLSLIDPQTLLTMDYELTRDTGLDALTHAVEAYVSLSNSFMTDMHALHAIELIQDSLPKCLDDLSNIEHRIPLMQASLEAGLAFSNASLGLVHSMAHSLGGLKDMAHGICNGSLLKNVCLYNFDTCPERFERISGRFGPGEGKKALEAKLGGFVEKVGLVPEELNYSFTREELESLAAFALTDACTATNPRSPTRDEIVELYERTFTGG